MKINFKSICEHAILEHELSHLLSNTAHYAVSAMKDYKTHVKDSKVDKQFLYNALRSEINDLRKHLKSTLSRVGVDVSTPKKFDDWIIDRIGFKENYKGLKYILHYNIKESKIFLRS